MRLACFFYCVSLLFGAAAANGQVCSGSLGDPIFNQTFGNQKQKLSPFKTDFDYISGCPPKNFYTIHNFLFGCGPLGEGWAKTIGDHTGDQNGDYMLVNGESFKGTVYRDTVTDACGSTTYQFGMWATAVMTRFTCGGRSLLPNIHYTVKSLSGTVLASDSTGKLPLVDETHWNFYGKVFKTPPGENGIIINISIDAPFGCGSAFALDDITISPCGPLINALLDGKPGPEEVCTDYTNPFVLTCSYTAGFADPVLQWQQSADTGKTWTDIPGATSSSYTIPRRDDGPVSYRATIAERTNISSVKCRVASNAIFTSVHHVPPHVFAADVFGCLGKTFFFPAPDPYSVTWVWTGPNGYNNATPVPSIPAISYADTGLYVFDQELRFGCRARDSLYLKVYPGTTLTLQPVQPICEGQQEQLFASATDSVGFAWIPGTGLSNPTIANPIARPKDSTEYKLIVTNRYGCKDSVYFKIDVFRNPVANAGPDKTILAGDTALLEGMVGGTAVNYAWTPATTLSGTSDLQPKAWPVSNSNYTLQVNSTVGCGSSSDDVTVKVYSSFLVPNAFSPNGDGINDRFGILQLDNYKVEDFSIYSRFGQRVFNTRNKYASWDGNVNGNPQSAGTYVYQIRLRSATGRLIEQRGSLLLLR
ncbi:MAG: gliding motility-associated C-terminal domain-containing protein [Bacteroidota bacterium]|nr:gliding motility-associated C-terminal domain-containing protein [Bacteroidota bacterium]